MLRVLEIAPGWLLFVRRSMRVGLKKNYIQSPPVLKIPITLIPKIESYGKSIFHLIGKEKPFLTIGSPKFQLKQKSYPTTPV